MLSYDFNRRGSTPKYIYLYEQIRDDIAAGKIEGGCRIPSKRALAQHLDIGIVTVANAYALLLTEGYIAAEERKGYFVSEMPPERDLSGQDKDVTPVFSREAELEEHEHFVDFKANRTSLKLFPSSTWNQLMRQALYQKGDHLLKTVPYNGLFELRCAIADYLAQNRGMRVDPSQVIIGAGTEYLYSRLAQMFGHACTFGFEDPGYKKLALIAGAYGNPCKFVAIDESGLRIDLLEQSGADVVHVSPANHFPTGIVMPITRRYELFKWADRVQKRYIVEDDYDSEFRYQGKYIPPLYAEDTQRKVIYLNTFSKTMVPSLRISYMVLPPQLLKVYQDTMSFYSCTVSSFEQQALADFIAQGYFERHINRIKHYYRKLRLGILEAIESSRLARIATVTEHNSGTHFLLTVHTRLKPDEVRTAALAADMVIPLYSEYSQSPEASSQCTLVINYAGIEADAIPEVVSRLEGIFPECAQL